MDFPSDADPKQSWEKMRRFLGDSDRELPLEDWFKFLQRFGEQNPSLAVRVLFRRIVNEVTDGRETDCAIPFFDSPFKRGRRLVAATADQPGRVLLPRWSGGRLQLEIFDHPGRLTGDPKLLGLETLPLGYLALESSGAKLVEAGPGLLFLGPAHIVYGCVKRAMRITQVYMEQRLQGGRHLADWSAPARQLEDLQWELRLWEEKLEALNQASSPAKTLAALIEMSRFAPRRLSTCMDLMGGAGYMCEYGLEQILRDVVTLSSVWGSVAEKRSDLSQFSVDFNR